MFLFYNKTHISEKLSAVEIKDFRFNANFKPVLKFMFYAIPTLAIKTSLEQV